jgi:hypothetical protein
MKLATIGILFLCLWSNLVWSREDAMKFTRPIVKGLVLERRRCLRCFPAAVATRRPGVAGVTRGLKLFESGPLALRESTTSVRMTSASMNERRLKHFTSSVPHPNTLLLLPAPRRALHECLWA